MTRKRLTIAIISLVILLAASQVFAQGSKFVMVLFDNIENDANILQETSFNFFIADRPDFILTNNSLASRIGYDENRNCYFVMFNVGNFVGSTGAPVDWRAGEAVNVEINSQGLVFKTDFPISSGGSLQIVETFMKTEDNEIPLVVTGLYKNYPNPFNPDTTIRFSLAEMDRVKLVIYNSRGQKVATLVDDVLDTGYHSIVWNGRDGRNREVSSGIYFYRMQKGSWTATNKMILIK